MDEAIKEAESPKIQTIISEINNLLNSRLRQLELDTTKDNIDTKNILKNLPIVKGLENRLDVALSEIKRLENTIVSLKQPEQSNITLRCSEIDSVSPCVTHDEISYLVGEEIDKKANSHFSKPEYLVGSSTRSFTMGGDYTYDCLEMFPGGDSDDSYYNDNRFDESDTEESDVYETGDENDVDESCSLLENSTDIDEITIDDKCYLTNDVCNGNIYNKGDNGNIGLKIGHFEDGDAFFAM